VVPDEVVDAAAVNGEGLVVVPTDHAGVLDVPGRPAFADPRIPVCRVSLFISVPQDKVASVPPHAGIGVLMESPLLFRPFFHIETVELAESRVLEGIEVAVPPMPVGGFQINKALDDLHGTVSSLRGPREKIRDLHPQRFHFLHKGLDILIGDVLDARFAFFRLFDRLVLDISEVHSPCDLIAQVCQVPDHDVLKEKGPEVADMGALVDRGTAGKYRDAFFIHRSKGLNALAEGVEEP